MSISIPRSFRLQDNIDTAITELMREENRTRSNMVNTLLAEALRNRKNKYQRFEERRKKKRLTP